MKIKYLIPFLVLFISLSVVSANDLNGTDMNTFDDVQNSIDNATEVIELHGTYISNGEDINISNKNITITGGDVGATLDADYSSGFFKIKSSNVTFININFINSEEETILKSDYNLNIINCTFTNNINYDDESENYLLDIAVGEYVNIINTTFVGNTNLINLDNLTMNYDTYEWKKVNIINCIFRNNRKCININSEDYVEQFKLNIEDCSFYQNGEDVYIDYNSDLISPSFTINIMNSSFLNSKGIKIFVFYDLDYFNPDVNVKSYVLVDNCRFINNSDFSDDYRYFYQSPVTIMDGTYSYDELPNNYRNAIKNPKNIDYTVSNCIFINNTNNVGCALHLDTFKGNLMNNYFFNNTQKVDMRSIYFIDEIGDVEFVIDCDNNIISTKDNINPDYNLSTEIIGTTYGNMLLNLDNTLNNKNISLKCYKFIDTDSNYYAKDYYKTTIKTDEFGEINSNIPLNAGINYIKMIADAEEYKIFKSINNITVNPIILKATAKQLTTTYNSGKIFNVNVDTASNVKIALKAFTGENYKTYYATVKNKAASFKLSTLSAGLHNIEIISGDSNYKISTVKSKITITKAKATVKAPKITAKFKKVKYFKVMVKSNKKSVKNLKVKVKVYTGNKYKTYIIKTDKKGVAKLNTKSLKIGKHKVIISSGNTNYQVSAKSQITIKR